MVEVLLAAALICFDAGNGKECHPALIGTDTRAGEYQLQLRKVLTPGYGGDVLQYDENDTSVFAIHRVWTLIPRENRVNRLTSGDPGRRKNITAGCVNVAPAIYDRLVRHHHSSRLIIK